VVLQVAQLAEPQVCAALASLGQTLPVWGELVALDAGEPVPLRLAALASCCC